MINRFTTEFRPISRGRGLKFMIWDNETGDIVQEVTMDKIDMDFLDPSMDEWKQKCAEMNIGVPTVG